MVEAKESSERVSDDSKYITYGEKSANDFKNEKLEALYKSSIENKTAHFDKLA